MRRAFERRRDLVVRLAREIPGLKVNNPDGAFYLFPEVSYYLGKADGDRVIKTSSELAMYILEVGHVATVAGDAFGAPNYLRLSYGYFRGEYHRGPAPHERGARPVEISDSIDNDNIVRPPCRPGCGESARRPFLCRYGLAFYLLS